MCLHGITDTWRTWELVLPALERHHEVLAPTLAGHAGGPPLGEITDGALADAVELAMDEAGFETAHLVGNSLGGYVALQLAARGRARSVVAFAPAGGWAQGDESYDLLDFQAQMQEAAKAAAPHADALRGLSGGPAPGDRVHHHELRAHPGRAARAPDPWRGGVLRGAPPDRLRAAARAGASTPSRSPVRFASCGAPTTSCCGGRRPPCATGTNGCPTRTGSSSTTWATAPSSTSRCEAAQLILGFTRAS